MTEAQIEKAARALCRMRGIDPEEAGMREDGFYVLRWRTLTYEVKRYAEVQQAIAEAMKDER